MNDTHTLNGSKTADGELAHFAGANSGKGFCGFYGEIFGSRDIVRRYLLKGGPGTGKSSFMRSVAERAQKAGYDSRYYRCSSDYTSLDAVIIGGRIAVIDATAPHSLEPELVGAKDVLVDLGQFWDADALFLERQEIERLCNKKSAAYTGAYRFLEGALALDTRLRELGESFIKWHKLRGAVARIAKKIPSGVGYSLHVGICNSIGMKGKHRLEGYEQAAQKIYLIDDCMRTANTFLACLAQKAQERGNTILVSYDPVNTSAIDALLFEEGGVAFVISDGVDSEKYAEKIECRINMKRFLQSFCRASDEEKRKKAEARYAKRVYDGLLDSAVECLHSAGEAHFALEKIYGSCMYFDAESRFCASIAEQRCRELDGMTK